MIKLTLHREPQWLAMPMGVRLKVHPLTTAIMVAARTDPAVRGIALGTPDDTIAVAFAKAIAARAIIEWEGVGDADGAPVSVTPDGVDALLDIWPIFEAFQTTYVAKGLELEAEKNVSAPLPIGSSVGAMATAPIATGPAPPARKSKTRRKA
jgi:hypothetical protein